MITSDDVSCMGSWNALEEKEQQELLTDYHDRLLLTACEKGHFKFVKHIVALIKRGNTEKTNTSTNSSTEVIDFNCIREKNGE